MQKGRAVVAPVVGNGQGQEVLRELVPLQMDGCGDGMFVARAFGFDIGQVEFEARVGEDFVGSCEGGVFVAEGANGGERRSGGALGVCSEFEGEFGFARASAPSFVGERRDHESPVVVVGVGSEFGEFACGGGV